MIRFERLMQSPIGPLTIESDGESVNALRFGDFSKGNPSCPALEQAVEELVEYFSGKRREFSVPLYVAGTDFQCAVWEALKTVPYGETVTYAEIAAKIGNPKACRAVGGANHRNQLPIFIPCHRVIGKDGKLVGYAGGRSIKEFLLELEKKNRE